MAQQITIDIVAETKKLTSGINEANDQLGGMSKQLKTAASAAAGLASAFVLKEGISFLKDGIEEAKDARTAMLAATSAFGKGSDAIEQITKDAEKFGKELAVDNDDIIKLATAIGVKLPKDAKSASAQLVLLAKNLEATSGGSIATEATLAKLGKAFADGSINAKELTKIVPGLDAATLKMVETLSKAGKNQEALNVLIEAGEKKYGGAAASQVTATQKFDVALANLKETIGTKVLPIIEQLIDFATKMIDAFDKQPDILKNVELALLGIVAIGGPLLGFLASAKTAMITLGIVSEGAAVGTTLLSTALKAIPIMAVIALVVLLITHWEDVQKVAKATWEAVSKWFGSIYDDIKDFIGKAIDWVKQNWPLLLGILTGPFGLFAAWIITHKDDVVKKFGELWDAVKTKVSGIVDATIREIAGLWNTLRDYLGSLFAAGKETIFSVLQDGWESVKSIVGGIVDALSTKIIEVWSKIYSDIADFLVKIVTATVDKFTEMKDKAVAKFKELQKSASEIWGLIKDYIASAVENIKDKFGEVYGKMRQVGEDIARGIGAGLTSMTGWFRTLLGDWIQRNIPDWAKTILKISSPSKVFAGIGTNIVKGLASGITNSSKITTPQSYTPSYATAAAPVNITINAGAGTDPYALGRAVSTAVNKYSRVSNRPGAYLEL